MDYRKHARLYKCKGGRRHTISVPWESRSTQERRPQNETGSNYDAGLSRLIQPVLNSFSIHPPAETDIAISTHCEFEPMETDDIEPIIVAVMESAQRTNLRVDNMPQGDTVEVSAPSNGTVCSASIERNYSVIHSNKTKPEPTSSSPHLPILTNFVTEPTPSTSAAAILEYSKELHERWLEERLMLEKAQLLQIQRKLLKELQIVTTRIGEIEGVLDRKGRSSNKDEKCQADSEVFTKAYERRDQSVGYSGPGQRNLSRDTLDSGNSGYVTKHSNYYKTEENNNPTQSSLYKNGDVEVTERKTVERQEKVFTYDVASQKQFCPKYIVRTMGRLRGIEGNGAILEEDDRRSQTLLGPRFYFGDEEGSLLSKHAASEPRRSTGGRSERELKFGVDDINLSISNKHNQRTNYSPTSRSERSVVSHSLKSPRPYGGANSPLLDDYQETYRITNSTPDRDITKPRISTDTSLKVSDSESEDDY